MQTVPRTAQDMLSQEGREGEKPSWEISTVALNLCPAQGKCSRPWQHAVSKEEVAHPDAVL